MTNPVIIDITIPNQTKYLGLIGRLGESLAFSLKSYQGNRRELAYHLNLVLTESLANAICHANNSDPEMQVKVNISASEQEIIVRVFDQGPGFDLEAAFERKCKENDEGGRGVQIIYKLMDEVSYRQEQQFNVLEMKKVLG
jgi:serine/threonine-protein kinase RsbW